MKEAMGKPWEELGETVGGRVGGPWRRNDWQENGRNNGRNDAMATWGDPRKDTLTGRISKAVHSPVWPFAGTRCRPLAKTA